MIFGKTKEECRRNRYKKFIEATRGVRKFAWFPQRLNNGQFVWLAFYYLYRSGWEHCTRDHNKVPYYFDLYRNSSVCSLSKDDSCINVIIDCDTNNGITDSDAY